MKVPITPHCLEFRYYAPPPIVISLGSFSALCIAHLHFDLYIMLKINDIAHYFRPAAGKFEQWARESEYLEEYRQMTLRTF